MLKPGGSISGIVTGNGGHPLAGVCAAGCQHQGRSAPGARPRRLFVIAFAGIRRGGLLAVTGRQGTYRISGLAAGSYQVTFIPCSGSFRYAEQWYRGKATALAATDVTVRAGKTTSGIDGRLVLGGTISGRVTGTTANPLRNICVVAVGQSGGPIGVAVTGKAGTYAIEGLASGRYTVGVLALRQPELCHGDRARAGDRAACDDRGRCHDAPGGSIAGVVTAGSASGPPVSESCVEVYSAQLRPARRLRVHRPGRQLPGKRSGRRELPGLLR